MHSTLVTLAVFHAAFCTSTWATQTTSYTGKFTVDPAPATADEVTALKTKLEALAHDADPVAAAELTATPVATKTEVTFSITVADGSADVLGRIKAAVETKSIAVGEKKYVTAAFTSTEKALTSYTGSFTLDAGPADAAAVTALKGKIEELAHDASPASAAKLTATPVATKTEVTFTIDVDDGAADVLGRIKTAVETKKITVGDKEYVTSAFASTATVSYTGSFTLGAGPADAAAVTALKAKIEELAHDGSSASDAKLTATPVVSNTAVTFSISVAGGAADVLGRIKTAVETKEIAVGDTKYVTSAFASEDKTPVKYTGSFTATAAPTTAAEVTALKAKIESLAHTVASGATMAVAKLVATVTINSVEVTFTINNADGAADVLARIKTAVETKEIAAAEKTYVSSAFSSTATGSGTTPTPAVPVAPAVAHSGTFTVDPAPADAAAVSALKAEIEKIANTAASRRADAVLTATPTVGSTEVKYEISGGTGSADVLGRIKTAVETKSIVVGSTTYAASAFTSMDGAAPVPMATFVPVPMDTSLYSYTGSFTVDPAPANAAELLALQLRIIEIAHTVPPVPFAPFAPEPFAPFAPEPFAPFAPVPVELPAVLTPTLTVGSTTVTFVITLGEGSADVHSRIEAAVASGTIAVTGGKSYTTAGFASENHESDGGSGSVIIVIIIIIVLLIIAAVAGAAVYFLVIAPKKKNKKTAPESYDNGAGSA